MFINKVHACNCNTDSYHTKFFTRFGNSHSTTKAISKMLSLFTILALYIRLNYFPITTVDLHSNESMNDRSVALLYIFSDTYNPTIAISTIYELHKIQGRTIILKLFFFQIYMLYCMGMKTQLELKRVAMVSV